MIFQFNPFQLNIPLGNVPIKSILITSNLDWLNVPSSALTGENINLPISAKTNVAALKVFGTGSILGTPSMISLTAAHIPNIAISQVTGLQSAINSLVKTLASANAALSVNNNGVGDYTLTPNFGTSINTFAQGNDTRFPASVTGLRKSSGAGSTDVAALAKTDYWNTDVFVASGASHAKGLVPDPGASAGATKFLREDATWAAPAGSGTVTNIATTSPIAGGPITTTGTLTLNVGVDFAWTVAQTMLLTNGTLNTDDPVLTLKHNSSGTPANGFGTMLKLQAKSSTTNDQDIGQIYAAWSNATHGARASYLGFRAVAAGILGDKMRLHASGGLSVNGIADPGAGVVSATGFKSSILSSMLKADGSGQIISAVRFTDYWDNTVFGGKGPSHAIGLVPDPGSGSAPFLRYLREDGTWQTFTPAVGSITNAQLATMAAKTLKANATAGSASPTDVDAKTARSASLLNLESITTFGDTNYTALATDRYVATSANLTATRTVTLPLANSFNPGQEITVMDDFGAINGAFVLNIARQGADTIQGSSSPLVMGVARGGYTLSSDGTSKWSVVSRRPAINRIFIVANTTYNTPTGVRALLVECLGSGGGGAGAQASASNASAGQGGGAGAYANKLITSPASSYAVVIGAGGAGGIGLNNGGNGAATTFGAAVSADGGQGGTLMASGTTQLFNNGGGLGGVAITGDSGSSGSDSPAAIRLSGTVAVSGDGAQAPMLGAARKGNTTEANGLGNTALGSGGAGALSTSTNAFNGGAGSQGVVIITEYY